MSLNTSLAKEGKYFVGPTRKSYCEAKQYCKSKGGELAIIRNEVQNTAASSVCEGKEIADNDQEHDDDDYHEDDHHEDDFSGSCWLGLTEYVGTAATPAENQLWIWGDGTAANIPQGNKYQRLSLEVGTKKRMVTSLSTYNYNNWETCDKCDENDKKRYEEHNNHEECVENQVVMSAGSHQDHQNDEGGQEGKWYKVSAHEAIEYYPLCEYTTWENPMHDHECDATFAFCWYEQCRNDPVGTDGSACWTKATPALDLDHRGRQRSSKQDSKQSQSQSKCSENYQAKYTDLEMIYTADGSRQAITYREYTCCNDQDDSGRTKHGLCYEEKGANWGAFLVIVMLCFLVCGGLFFCFLCLRQRNNKHHAVHQQQQHQPHQHQQQFQPQMGVQMINMGRLQQQPQMIRVTVPANGVPGSTILVPLPNGGAMHVIIPPGTIPGNVLNVQVGGGGGGGVVPIQPVQNRQNRDVPQLPAHNFVKVTSVMAVPINSGGAYKQQHQQPNAILQTQLATPMMISEPQIVSHSQLQQQQVLQPISNSSVN